MHVRTFYKIQINYFFRKLFQGYLRPFLKILTTKVQAGFFLQIYTAVTNSEFINPAEFGIYTHVRVYVRRK